jgi:hypothetical protein
MDIFEMMLKKYDAKSIIQDYDREDTKYYNAETLEEINIESHFFEYLGEYDYNLFNTDTIFYYMSKIPVYSLHNKHMLPLISPTITEHNYDFDYEDFYILDNINFKKVLEDLKKIVNLDNYKINEKGEYVFKQFFNQSGEYINFLIKTEYHTIEPDDYSIKYKGIINE